MNNLINYILLYNDELEYLKNTWDVDWCSFYQFESYVFFSWCLNRDVLNGMSFTKFFLMEKVLLKETPEYFKYIFSHNYKTL